jgi:hypothetical protein
VCVSMDIERGRSEGMHAYLRLFGEDSDIIFFFLFEILRRLYFTDSMFVVRLNLLQECPCGVGVIQGDYDVALRAEKQVVSDMRKCCGRDGLLTPCDLSRRSQRHQLGIHDPCSALGLAAIRRHRTLRRQRAGRGYSLPTNGQAHCTVREDLRVFKERKRSACQERGG